VKAVRYSRYGGPEVLRLEEVEPPTPNDDEVLVRVRSTTVSRSDAGHRSAEYFVSRFYLGLFRLKEGSLGLEFAGEVASVGKNVTNFAPGERVFGIGSGTNASTCA